MLPPLLSDYDKRGPRAGFSLSYELRPDDLKDRYTAGLRVEG